MFLLLVAATVLVLIWRYYKTQQNYWRGRGITGPKSRFFFGNFYDLFDLQRPSGLVLREWTKILQGIHNGRYLRNRHGSKWLPDVMFNNPLSEMASRIFMRKMDNPFYASGSAAPFLKNRVRFLLRNFGRVSEVVSHFYGPIYKTIDERIAQREKDAADGIEPGEPSDFVDLFLDAKADSDYIDKGAEFSKTNAKISRVLTRDEIVAQCFVFLLAGFDTTSNSLAYTSWLLANNPKVMKKIQKKIDDVCGTDEIISYDSISRMKYTEAVMKETLRMYPLASLANSRTAVKDTSLGGIPIEKGTLIQMDGQCIMTKRSGETMQKNLDQKDVSTSLQDPRLRWEYVGANEQAFQKQLRLLGANTVSPEATTVYLRKRVML